MDPLKARQPNHNLSKELFELTEPSERVIVVGPKTLEAMEQLMKEEFEKHVLPTEVTKEKAREYLIENRRQSKHKKHPSHLQPPKRRR